MLIIFDVDGTLIGGERTDWKCFDDAFAEAAGFPLTSDFFYSLKEVTAHAIVHQALDGATRQEKRVVEAKTRQGYVARLVRAIQENSKAFPPIEGAVSLLRDLKSRSVPVAIATGDWKESSTLKLRSAGIPFQDMGSIIQKMDVSDMLVFARPVYFDSMPSNIRKMIDRLRVTLDAFFEFREGRTYHLKRKKKKQNVILIFTAGNPERESFVSISRVFNRIIDNMGWQLEGEFHFPTSHLLVAEPELLSTQLEAVTRGRQQFGSERKISSCSSPRALAVPCRSRAASFPGPVAGDPVALLLCPLPPSGWDRDLVSLKT